MKVKELRNELELYDGDMEITIVDVERNEYYLNGIGLNIKESEPRLEIRYE